MISQELTDENGLEQLVLLLSFAKRSCFLEKVHLRNVILTDLPRPGQALGV
jgi:hypothetical protein